MTEINTLCEDYLDGKILFVPEGLKDRLENESLRKERREAYYLTWAVIKSGYFESEKTAWKGINSSNFRLIASKDSMIKNAKEWLESHGFIEWNRSYVTAASATERNPARPQQYKIKNWSPTTTKRLENKNVVACLVRNEPTEPELKYSREQLDLLEPNIEQLKIILRKVLWGYRIGIDIRKPIADQKGVESGKRKIKNREKPEWRDDEVQMFGLPLLKLIHKSGVVKRGNTVRRLFSPLTNLMREFRQGFTYDGKAWVNLDMTCSQPTLLAYECADNKMIGDCIENSFYDKIAESLDGTRDEAKQAYCAYAYGKNRSARSTNKVALQVQKFMENEYPKTYQHVWNSKKVDHTTFIRRMQDKEASIFIDGVFSELRTRKIPSLTIHDSILSTNQHEQEIREVIVKELNKQGIKQEIKTERQTIKTDIC